MGWRTRKDGRHYQEGGHGVSGDLFSKLRREDQYRMMDYGDAKGHAAIRKMVKKYTEYGSVEKGYRPRTLDNVNMKELRKIPTSFLYVVYENADKGDSRALPIGLELERRHVFKQGYTLEHTPAHMIPRGLSDETMAYYKDVLRQEAERNRAFSRDLTGSAKDYGIT